MDNRIRIRANRSTGELEIDGGLQQVAEWWERIWPELSANPPPSSVTQTGLPANAGETPALFGEFFSEFRAGITDVDKVMVAAAFVQDKEQDRCFTTKAANQLLMDQNIKVANASESVRRLTQTKRVFVVSPGKFRVSALGFEYLDSLKSY